MRSNQRKSGKNREKSGKNHAKIVQKSEFTGMAEFVFGEIERLLVADGAQEVAQRRARRHARHEELVARQPHLEANGQ